MDANVRGAVTRGLRQRGIDVVTAQDDDADELLDPQLLDRATELGRVLFTQDEDLLAEAARRQQAGVDFAGVIYAHQDKVPIGRCVEDLELIALIGEPEEFANRVEYLSLRR
jgi:hypothetical protein